MDDKAHLLLWENAHIVVKQVDYIRQTKEDFHTMFKHSAFLIITEGKVDVIMGQDLYHVQQFSIFHLGMSQSIHLTTTEQYSYYVMQYKGDMIYRDTFIQYLDMKIRPFYSNFSCVPANPISIKRLLQQLHQNWTMQTSSTSLYVKSLFYEFVYQIFRAMRDGASQPHEIDLAESACLYLEQHIHEPITVQLVAESLKISTRQLLHVFKERYGCGPQIYLQNRRMAVAQKLLQDHRFSMKEIAVALGYEDELYFSRVFKKQLHMSPTTYQLKYLYKKSDYSINIDNHYQYNKSQPAQVITFESRGHMEMRKSLIKSLQIPFLASLLFLLAACGEELKQENTAKSNKEETEEVNTHIVTDGVGREVEIPVEPQRIVTDQYVEYMLALGISPVGAGGHTLRPEYIQDYIENIENLGNPLNLESTLSLNPDLIISSQEPGNANLENYEKIAPTVSVPWASLDLYEMLKSIAPFIGKEQEAVAWIANIEAKGKQAQQQIQPIISKDETVSIIMTYGKDVPRVYGARNIGHIFYRLLGLKPTPFIEQKIKEDPEFVFEEISIELVSEHVGDWLVILDYGTDDADSGKTLHDLKESGIWANLDAVKNNQVIYLPAEPFLSYSPIAIEHSLDQAVELIK